MASVDLSYMLHSARLFEDAGGLYQEGQLFFNLFAINFLIDCLQRSNLENPPIR